MASRVIAQLLVAGATTLLRAGSQAFAKALQNAQQSGVAQEAGKAAARSSASMSVQEARTILEVGEQAPWAEVMKRYKHLFDVNEKHGSFYLQSKVYRAWEALDEDYTRRGVKPPGGEGGGGGGAAAGEPQQQQPEQQQQQQQPGGQQQQSDRGR